MSALLRRTTGTAAAKRVLDVVAASVAVVIAAPVMLAATIAVRRSSPGPALFRQERAGRDGHPFTVLKLRTMYHGVDDRAHRDQIRRELEGAGQIDGPVAFKRVDDVRITPVGRWLRRFSIDELPQLINVLRGEMSLVGPRPIPAYELDMYPTWSRARLSVLPGITGLWQVSGRNHLSTIEMLELDCRYASSWTLRGDLRIIAKTFAAVFNADGAA